jgi:hypothetical protein
MPSFLSKFSSSSKRNNPYLNVHHPGYASLPQNSNTQLYTTSKPISTFQSVPPVNSRNLLAEARQVAHRDPITGRPLPYPIIPPTASETVFESSARSNGFIEKPGVDAEKGARAGQIVQTTGSRYDLVASEERRMREEAERIIKTRGGLEFYAPERRMEEFYSGGVRD